MPSTAKKTMNRNAQASNRLEARVSGEQKSLFQRAAALKGFTLTDFIIDSLQQAAIRTVEQHDVLKLNAESKAAFFDALLNPPAPNKALRRAADRYRQMTER
jgi:uncharacterized protein (DUF1778 family)